MIEIVDACTKSGNEWCTCCQKQTNTKRIKFSNDGRQGNSVVLCDDCRQELAQAIQAVPLERVERAKNKICDISPIYNTSEDGRFIIYKNYDDIISEVSSILDEMIKETKEVKDSNETIE